MHRVEETRRIGWSPIATDRRPNGRQNILRSGVLTISSIKLSPGRSDEDQRGRRGRRRVGGSKSKSEARKIGNLLDAGPVILREKLCICVSYMSYMHSRGMYPGRRTKGIRVPLQISAYKSPFRQTSQQQDVYASRAVHT